MRRAEIVVLLSVQEGANRSINWNWISGRLYATETETSIRVRRKFSAQIHFRLLRILSFVKADGRRMPDIHLGSPDRFAILLAHPPLEKNPRPWGRGSHNGTT